MKLLRKYRMPHQSFGLFDCFFFPVVLDTLVWLITSTQTIERFIHTTRKVNVCMAGVNSLGALGKNVLRATFDTLGVHY